MPIGGGGPRIDADEFGLGAPDAPVFRRFAIEGVKARGLAGPF